MGRPWESLSTIIRPAATRACHPLFAACFYDVGDGVRGSTLSTDRAAECALCKALNIWFHVDRGVYSAARLMKLGIEPHSPAPARKRNSKICCSVAALAVHRVNTPSVAVA